MKGIHVTATATAAALVCAHGPAAAADRPRDASMVRLERACPGGGGTQALGAALLGVVLAPLIKAGIDGLGDALAKAGAKKDAHRIAYGDASFYAVTLSDAGAAVDLAPGCLVLAFGPAGGGSPPFEEMEATEAVTASLKEAGFAAAPAVYLEAGIEMSPDRTAFRLKPTYAWVGDPIGPAGAASRTRDLAISFSFMLPGPSDDAAALASRTVVLKGAGTRRLLDDAELGRLRSSWMPIPPVPDAVTTRIGEASKRWGDHRRLQEARAAPAGGKPTAADRGRLAEIARQTSLLEEAIAQDATYLAAVAPVNVRVDLHETRDGNALLAKLGGFLSGNAAGLAQPIADAADPVKRRAARAADIETAVAADAAEGALRIAAITEVEALNATLADAASTPAQRRVAALTARAACRALELRRFADPACLPSPR